jgi:signal transduction histidine kinase
MLGQEAMRRRRTDLVRIMYMNNAPLELDETAGPTRCSLRWWLFPIFWAVVFCIGLALSTLTLYRGSPQRLSGWSGIGLGALLVANFGVYMLLAWGWLYHDEPMSARRGLAYFGVQMLLQLLLIWRYSPSFAWISLALLYPVIGGLPKRQLPLPVTLLVLVFAFASWPGADSATAALTIFVQILINTGIAIGLRLISSQGNRLRVALAKLRQAHVELAASAAQKEELAVLRERARLARAMHDNLGHALVVMNVKLEAAQLLYAHDSARGDAELEATRALIRETMTELRRALSDLRAPATEHGDLPSALQRLVREMQARTGIATICRIAPDLPPLPAEAREALWYVAREALTNVERHAGAASITLALEHPPDGWLLRVEDDGTGIHPADQQRPEHYGVVGMRERMNGIGGSLQIYSGVRGGTIVEARLPEHAALEARVR